ncbi:MAG: hypothetical protein NW203_06635 [Hyphomonadaceae bacterium]|nr:hypothetical protein [Hyphomonadaceae bacterium]
MAAAPSAHAQGVTAEAVAEGFVAAVRVCVASRLTGAAIADLAEADRAGLLPGDATLREFMEARAEQPVWTTQNGAGIVAIVEHAPAQCNVTAYGPRVEPVMAQVAAALQAAYPTVAVEPLERRPDALVQRFSLTVGEARISVLIDGGEPGMRGRRFRFPLLMAFVQRRSAAP